MYVSIIHVPGTYLDCTNNTARFEQQVPIIITKNHHGIFIIESILLALTKIFHWMGKVCLCLCHIGYRFTKIQELL